MLQHRDININRHIGMLVLLGLVASIGVGLVGAIPTHAAECTNGGVSCIAVEFGQPVGDRTVNPSSNVYSATQFYLPVTVNIEHGAGYAVDYAIKVYGSGNALTNTEDASSLIPSVLQNTSYNDLGKNGSEWGIRWNFGDKIEDAYTDYRPVPASSNDASAVVVADGKMDKNTSSLEKKLTLGFAVAVNGSQASGSYTNTVTVAVVASPKDARTLFDIATMQEMTSEICERTTTPTTTAISTGADINATASGASYTTAIDTTGAHQGDGAYVPQRELTDTRDGKKYTIRKLADGNCWMVSNLEFDLVPAASKDLAAGTTPISAFSTTGEDKLTGSQLVLTNKDTDLNSMREWTPTVAAELYGTAGTVYRTQRNAGQGEFTETPSVVKATPWAQDGTDGLRSFSSTAAIPNTSYSVKVANTPAFGVASTGESWQKFGNLYNWTAATLGSGTELTAHGSNAEDSICPRGWRLPYDSGNRSFAKLLGAYGLPSANTTDTIPTKVNQLANFPLNFLRTGSYNYDGNLRYQKADGNWWGGTRFSAELSKGIYTSLNHILVNNGNDAGLGLALRCVAR